MPQILGPKIRSAPVKKSSLASFEVLVRKVKETFLEGNQAVKKQIFHTCWLAGKYIHEHILHHQDRAGYGEKILSQLSRRVDKSERSLERFLKLYRRIPEISTAMSKLDITHLYSLSTISDEDLRNAFAKRALEGNWDTRELQSKIKTELRSEKVSPFKNKPHDYSEIIRPKLGTLYTYRLIESKLNPAELKIDQGFSVYKFDLEIAAKLKANQIVESKKDKNNNYSAVKSSRGDEDLFTYKARVERVVDADTLFVEIDLGFTNTTRQYLRLRAIDAPELDTEAGKSAKKFVEKILSTEYQVPSTEKSKSGNSGLGTSHSVPFVFLTSTRSDKYDRYLADVFIPGKEFLKQWNSGTADLKESNDLIYLNNELLKRKLAVRMRY